MDQIRGILIRHVPQRDRIFDQRYGDVTYWYDTTLPWAKVTSLQG